MNLIKAMSINELKSLLDDMIPFSGKWNAYLRNHIDILMNIDDLSSIGINFLDKYEFNNILNKYSAVSYHAHIDHYDCKSIYGWVKHKHSENPIFISLLINGKVIERFMPCNIFRKDLKKANIGNGFYGFVCNIPEGTVIEETGYISLVLPDLDTVIYFLLYDKDYIKDEEKLTEEFRLEFARGNTARALKLLKILCEKFPQNVSNWNEAAKIAIQIKDWSLAEKAYGHAIELGARHELDWATLPLKNDKSDLDEDMREVWKRLIVLMHENDLPNSSPEWFRTVSGLLSALLRARISPFIQYYNNCFIGSQIFSVGKQANIVFNRSNLFVSSVAIYVEHAIALNYILAVIRIIPAHLLSIVIGEPEDSAKSALAAMRLDNYLVYFGKHNLKKFTTLFFDQQLFRFGLKDLPISDKKIICYVHGVEADLPAQAANYGPSLLEKTHLAIAASEKQIAPLNRCTIQTDKEQLAQIRYTDKCEYAWTGPFQIPDQFWDKQNNKNELKQELSEYLQCDIPSGKPLIVCMDDDYASRKQLFRILNKLSEKCTIIIKYVSKIRGSESAHLNPKIIVYPELALAPNLLMFAADYIMCGPYGSTCLSSLMSGLAFIPYYSRICFRIQGKKLIPERLPDSYHFHLKPDPLTANTNELFRYKYKYFFDLVDYDQIQSAIFDDWYRNWYADNLASLQEYVFGKFMLKGAAQKTAELIFKFAAEGTIGDDCGCMYLKNSAFSQA